MQASRTELIANGFRKNISQSISPVLLLHTSKRAYTGVRDADHNSGPFKYSLFSYDTGAVMYERESIKKSGNIGGSALRPLAMVVKEPIMHVGSTSVRYASFLRSVSVSPWTPCASGSA